MANYYVLLTDYGKSFIANAQANSQLALTHVVLGDANDQPYLPESRLNQTSLVKQRAKQPIASVKIINDTTAEVTAVIPSNVGGFNVHEIGVTDSSGKLVYVGNFHGGYRPTLTEGAGGDMELIITIKADNLATVVIEAESQTVVATREWVTERFVTKPEFQEHLDAIDPHSQYLNQQRFSQFLQLAYPYGHKYWTHNKANPKPLFDAMFGFETHWRRLEGVGLVAVKDGDAFIGQSMLTLGQRGTTELATTERPHTYPIYTSYLFERYNPDDVVETVWNVTANKTAITEGEAVRFTVTANNLPDGQILDWSVKEGELNADSNNIDAPEKSESGTVILKNGQAVIDFVTTPDDNAEETQKHVRLTVGAPANLSINVPISDAGHNETVLHISQSTTDGISLDEYYYTQYGAYPAVTDTVRFIVDDGVDIIAPNTETPAITEGTNWPSNNPPIIENHGRILGRGGAGGRSAEYLVMMFGNDADQIKDNASWVLPTDGENGGLAVASLNTAIIIENYNLVAGGGGGGAGVGAVIYRQDSDLSDGIFQTVGGGGAGGGAPYGQRSANANTIESYYQHHAQSGHTPFDYAKETEPMRSMRLALSDSVTSECKFYYWYPPKFGYVSRNIPPKDSQLNSNKPSFFLPHYEDDAIHYTLIGSDTSTDADKSQPSTEYEGTTVYQARSVSLRQSSNGTIINGGDGGYGGISAEDATGINLVMLNYFENMNFSQHIGGSGGNLGASGSTGESISKASINKLLGSHKGIYQKWHEIPAASTGGLAGYISQGNVTINNYGSGTTKGR